MAATTSLREYFQYQRVAEPVILEGLAEATTVDRWYSPFSQHVRLFETVSRKARPYVYPCNIEPSFVDSTAPAPMPDAVLSTQLVGYPLPNHIPEGMVGF